MHKSEMHSNFFITIQHLAHLFLDKRLIPYTLHYTLMNFYGSITSMGATADFTVQPGFST